VTLNDEAVVTKTTALEVARALALGQRLCTESL
jgi:hypothetical protein